MNYAIKLYLAVLSLEAYFVVQVNFWDALDAGLKRSMTFIGVVLALLTLVKLYQDITKTRLEKKKLRNEIKKQEAV